MTDKVFPPTELERYVNHPNFKRLEEKKDSFIIFMKSVELRKVQFPPLAHYKTPIGDLIIYFNIDRSARVASKTYSITIKKKWNKNPSRIRERT